MRSGQRQRTGSARRPSHGADERPRGRLRLLRTALLIAVFLTLWVALNYGNLRQLAQATAERDRERAAAAEMEARLEDMRRLSRALVSDNRAVERAAREQHRMTHEGEVLVLLDREPTGN